MMTSCGSGSGLGSIAGGGSFSASIKVEVKYDIPDCAPEAVKEYAAYVDKFERGSEAVLSLYKQTLAELGTVLKLGSDATAAQITDYINNSVQVSCKFQIVVKASAEASFNSSAAVNNDEAKMIANGEAKASLEIRTEFVCDTTTDPIFTGENLVKIKGLIEDMKVVATLAHGLKLKSEEILADGAYDAFVASINEVTTCPLLATKWPEMQKEFSAAVQTAGTTWDKCSSAASGSANIVSSFDSKFAE